MSFFMIEKLKGLPGIGTIIHIEKCQKKNKINITKEFPK